MDKQAWRRRLRAERSELVIDHAATVAALQAFLAAVVPDGRVVVYDAMADEVDLSGLLRADPAPEHRFAVTRTPVLGHDLTLHPFGGPSEQHRYGYRQPLADGPIVADGDVAAVLVPGLGFDRWGTRLGRGAGYYDRLLSRLGPGVVRVGMTAGIVVERLPSDDHDVAMTSLATADGVLSVPLVEAPAGGFSSW